MTDHIALCPNPLRDKGYDLGTVQNVYVSRYSPSGNAIQVTVEGTAGSRLFTGDTCRTIFNSSSLGKSVRSLRYTITGGNVLGAAAATAAVVIPPYILMLYASHFVRRHQESPIIKGVFMGLRPVVVGLIASAALLLMNKENFGSETVECVKSILICVVTFFFAHFTKVHPILLIIVAGLAGYFIF